MPPREDVKALARGRWSGILQALGVPDRHLVNRHGPCPQCGGKDRFRFDDKDARGTWICSHCGAGDGFSLVMLLKGVDFKGAALLVKQAMGRAVHEPYMEPKHKPAHEHKNDKARAASLWQRAQSLVLTDPVLRYLQNRRVAPLTLPADLRYAQAVPYWHDGRKLRECDAMLALVRDKDGNAITVHCTYLDDGHKAGVASPKKVLSAMGVGSSIRLYEPSDTLALTEGIETALAVYNRTGVATWATISAQGMKNFVCPQDVHKVEIWADNDASYTGQEAAYALARRLRTEGKYVAVYLPAKTGTDWADFSACESGNHRSRQPGEDDE